MLLVTKAKLSESIKLIMAFVDSKPVRFDLYFAERYAELFLLCFFIFL